MCAACLLQGMQLAHPQQNAAEKAGLVQNIQMAVWS